MRKILFISLIAMLALPQLRAQDPLHTQFMTNPFLVNPAITGTYPHYQIITNNRVNMVGLGDAPVTNTISMYGPMVEQPMGLGGYINHFSFGPQSKTTFHASYAYNYDIAEDLHVSMGLRLGAFMQQFNGMDIEEDLDPVYNDGQVVKLGMKPDASYGIYAWGSLYNGGFAITNLLGNNLDFISNDPEALEIPDSLSKKDEDALTKVNRNFYLHGGYKYYFNRELAVEPSAMLRMVAGTSPQFEINTRVWYGKRNWGGTQIWGGLAYRTAKSKTEVKGGAFMNIIVGVVYQKKIEIGYGYDLGFNKLSPYNSGSQELMITFRFNDIKEY